MAVRDLWARKELGNFDTNFTATVSGARCTVHYTLYKRGALGTRYMEGRGGGGGLVFISLFCIETKLQHPRRLYRRTGLWFCR